MKYLKLLITSLLLNIGLVYGGSAGTSIESSNLNQACCIDHNELFLNFSEFGTNIQKALDDVGYVIKIQRGGKTVFSQSSGFAKTPLDGNVIWSPDITMHTASVSKLITAIGLKRLLLRKDISIDEKIIDYLPGSWNKGSNIDQITFRQLMTHTSGFKGIGSTTNYIDMKQAVNDGVVETGKYDYENVNFSLSRILSFFILYGKQLDIKNNWSDQYINDVSKIYYLNFMQYYVFHPAGVYGATTISNPSHALAYPIAVASRWWNEETWTPTFSGGWPQGDLSETVGGTGWSLSVNELLKLMHSFRSSETIMPKHEAQKLLDDRLGIDVVDWYKGKRYYHKNGGWGKRASVQSLIYLMPDNVEIAVYVNSPLPSKASFRGVITDLIQKYLPL